ncbi:MAG: YihY/virulence factor BrkB family protein [Vulcanimicrobiaceae bacterium]
MIDLIKTTWSEFERHNAGWLAAALAYYTMFAIAPLILIIAAMASIFLGAHQHALTVMLTYLAGISGPGTSAVQQVVASTASEPRSGFIAASIGWIVFLIGAIGLVQALQTALNTIWDVVPKKMTVLQMLGQRARSLAFMMGIALLLVVAISLDGIVATASGYLAALLPGLWILGPVVGLGASFAVLWLGFSMVFYFVPECHVDWRDVRIGAALTALFFVIGQVLLGIYLGRAATSSMFGAMGSLVLFLLWVNYSAQIMLLGAQFTQVYARHRKKLVLLTLNRADGEAAE